MGQRSRRRSYNKNSYEHNSRAGYKRVHRDKYARHVDDVDDTYVPMVQSPKATYVPANNQGQTKKNKRKKGFFRIDTATPEQIEKIAIDVFGSTFYQAPGKHDVLHQT